MEEQTASSINCWENWTVISKGIKLDYFSHHIQIYTQNGLKILMQNLKPYNSQKKTQAVYSLTALLAMFSWMCCLRKGNKNKQTNKNKCDYIKLKSICGPKETDNKMKKQKIFANDHLHKRLISEQEKIFANDISNGELIPKIYTEFIKLNIKTKNTLIKEMGRGADQTFFQRRNTDGQKQMKRISIPLIMEMQIEIKWHTI